MERPILEQIKITTWPEVYSRYVKQLEAYANHLESELQNRFTEEEVINFHIEAMKQGLIDEGEEKWKEAYRPKVKEVAEKVLETIKANRTK